MMKQSRQPETEKMVFRLPLDDSHRILLAIPRKHRQPENAIHRFRLPFSMVHLFARASVSPLTTSRGKPLHPTRIIAVSGYHPVRPRLGSLKSKMERRRLAIQQYFTS